MATKGIYTVHHRRKREGRTNYRKRISYIKSKIPRLVVRRFNKNIIAQVVDFLPIGDKISLTVHSSELKKIGWNYNTGNLPSAYLVGLLLGTKSESKKMILDMGLHTPINGSRIFAVLKGVIDAGIEVPHSPEKLPSDERINGSHISKYAASLKENKERYDKQFSNYIKNNLDPQKIVEEFENAKNKILKSS
ncbi:50S ribosomal protein L18 [archaeon]|jgi:large subunit ribosomal protein L18|nr:50S ribosomal protein L18 [archaeon]MBT4351306.1 50S ribosomal protein L18 [archaeon]MBT4646848.1 50S ribosomal protein L18 [archaeon]MBT6822093.1 50S ribosomal protein L18 [archaeon]MBT7392582.1 50S ribosomal protein L18 [archaeon]